MAELVLKIGTVGPDPAYQDGDIVEAFNEHRILSAHAQNFCRPALAGFTPDGLRPTGSLLEALLSRINVYKFERISRTGVVRTDIRGGTQDLLSPEALDVREFITRRLKHPAHVIFGTPGREVWYGKSRYFDVATIASIWDVIEAQTPERRINYQKMGHSDLVLKHYLVLTVDDFDGVVGGHLLQPVRQITNEGTEQQTAVLTKRRQSYVDWRSLDLGETVKRIENRNIVIDTRDTKAFVRNGLVQEKV